jgi:hypothetical protein
VWLLAGRHSRHGGRSTGVNFVYVQGVSIALSTEDVARSVKFYVEQLGFTCALQLEGFARVRPGAADIMRGEGSIPVPLPPPALLILK